MAIQATHTAHFNKQKITIMPGIAKDNNRLKVTI